MGKFNVVRPDGTVISVDADELGEADQTRPETSAEADARAKATADKERYGGVLGQIASFGAGIGNTLSFGGLGKAAQYSQSKEQEATDAAAEEGGYIPSQERNPIQGYARENPGSYMLGGAAAMAVPFLGEAGGAAAGAEGVAGASEGGGLLGAAAAGGPGLARYAGRAIGGGYRGAALEGAILGAGTHVADTSVTGDPLTVEGMIESAGVGAILNVGMHGLGNGIAAVGKRAQAARAMDTVNELLEEQSAETAKTAAKVFTEDTPAWRELTDSYEAQQAAYKSANKEILSNNAEYDDFVSGRKLGRAIDRADAVVTARRNLFDSPIDAAAMPGEAVADGSGRGVVSDLTQVNTSARPIGTTNEGVPITRPPIEAGVARGPVTNKIIGITPDGEVIVRTADKLPISPEEDARLAGFRKRISDAYKQKSGGFKISGDGEWVKAPGTPPDRVGALENLRGIYADLEKAYSKYSNSLSDLPAPKIEPIQWDSVDLPKRVRDFAKAPAEQVARIANNLSDVTHNALGKVAEDFGLELKSTPNETLAAVQKKLQDMSEALEKAKIRAATPAKATGPLAWLQRGAKVAAAHTAGGLAFGAVGGGMLGVGAGAATRAATHAGMSGIEDAVIGGADSAMMATKMSFRQKIADVVAKYAAPTAAKVKALGPVTAVLHNSFPSGRHDHERDLRKLANSRIAEITAAAQTAPDTVYSAVSPLLGHPSDAAYKIHSGVVGSLQGTAAAFPKDPGIATRGFTNHYVPTVADAMATAYRLEAMTNPTQALSRVLSGDVHQAAVDTLRRYWPAMVSEAAGEIVQRAPKLGYLQTKGVSSLLGSGSGLQAPGVALSIQGQYMMQSQPSAQSTPRKSGTGGPGGRPPAISNPVAGSSVTSLLSQQ
jgi:hypothetical protein